MAPCVRSVMAVTLLVLGCTDTRGPAGPALQPDLVSALTEAAPSPGPTDRLLFDARTALQAARDLEAALEVWGYDDDRRRFWGFTADVDGSRTHALRLDWPGRGPHSCRDVSPSLGRTLPNPRPQRLYVQWKQRLGRTATGGGHGPIGEFQVLHPRCRGADARRFVWTLGRDHDESGDEHRRVDLRWKDLGGAPRPVLNVKRTPLDIGANRGWDFAPQAHVNETIEHTLYAEAESAPGAEDGVVRLWVNGRLLIDSAGVATGTERFRRFNFPWTGPSPARQQTEYVWDVVVWEPPAVAAVTVTPEAPELSLPEALQLSVNLRDATGASLSYPFVRWSSDDPSVATVSASGLVTAVGPGFATITATSQGRKGHARVRVGRDWFAASSGSPAGDGTRGRPWDLATALAGGRGAVEPGDTIWVRGGTYTGEFRSTLTGTAARPIVVRRHRGERAIIDGVLRADGADVTFWGLEIMQSDPVGTSETGLLAFAPGARYINLVVHDAGENGISFRTATGFSEVYGSIIYNNGVVEHLDQGIYAPNDAGEKRITDNIVFNNMASGIQVFGTPDHPRVTGVRVVGNISFNNGTISSAGPTEENITVGGSTVTQEVTVEDNFLFFGGAEGQNLRLGLAGNDNRDVIARRNYVVGGATVFRIEDWATAVIEHNTFVGSARMLRMSATNLADHSWTNNVHHRPPYARAWNFQGTLYDFAGWRAATGLGATDQALTDPPSETKVAVRPNRYERGRAHVVIYNWTGEPSAAVDVSAVLRHGDRYELRNVQDLFGPPVLSGTYTGGLLAVPMDGVAPPVAAGRPGGGVAPRTAPMFDVFVLTLVEP